MATDPIGASSRRTVSAGDARSRWPRFPEPPPVPSQSSVAGGDDDAATRRRRPGVRLLLATVQARTRRNPAARFAAL